MAGTGNSCEDLVLKQIIVGGKQGEQGIQGPPGESVQLPLPASDISVTNPGYANLQELLDDLLYEDLVVSSFYTATTLFENRDASNPSADFTMNFTWAYNKAVASQTLTGPGAMTPVSLTAEERNKTVTMTDFNSNGTFTIEGTDAESQMQSRNINVTFTDAIYYGDAAIPGAVNSTFIMSLTKNLKTNNVVDAASNTGSGQYFWFATPVSRGTPTFMVSGFPASMESPTVVSFTNSLGYTVDYNVYRATNDDLGAITYNIS